MTNVVLCYDAHPLMSLVWSLVYVGQLKLKLYRDENGELKGDGRCCYLKVGGRGWEVLLPQGRWEGMGGAATSRWVGGDGRGCYSRWVGADAVSLGGVVVLEQPSPLLASRAQRESVDLAIQLLNDSDYRGYRIYVELVSHQLQRGHVHLQRQSPAAACPVYCQPLRQEQTVADVYFVCYDQRAAPLTKWDHLLL